MDGGVANTTCYYTARKSAARGEALGEARSLPVPL